MKKRKSFQKSQESEVHWHTSTKKETHQDRHCSPFNCSPVRHCQLFLFAFHCCCWLLSLFEVVKLQTSACLEVIISHKQDHQHHLNWDCRLGSSCLWWLADDKVQVLKQTNNLSLPRLSELWTVQTDRQTSAAHCTHCYHHPFRCIFLKKKKEKERVPIEQANCPFSSGGDDDDQCRPLNIYWRPTNLGELLTITTTITPIIISTFRTQ